MGLFQLPFPHPPKVAPPVSHSRNANVPLWHLQGLWGKNIKLPKFVFKNIHNLRSNLSWQLCFSPFPTPDKGSYSLLLLLLLVAVHHVLSHKDHTFAPCLQPRMPSSHSKHTEVPLSFKTQVKSDHLHEAFSSTQASDWVMSSDFFITHLALSMGGVAMLFICLFLFLNVEQWQCRVSLVPLRHRAPHSTYIRWHARCCEEKIYITCSWLGTLPREVI